MIVLGIILGTLGSISVTALTTHGEKYAQLNVEVVTNALFMLIEGAVSTSRIYRKTWPFRAARLAAESLIG